MADERGFGYFAVIPAPVLTNQELPDKAKLLYAVISALATERGYCWATDAALAQRLKCGERTISRSVSQLKELGFVHTDVVPASEKKGGKERRIFVGAYAVEGIASFVYTGIAKNGETNIYSLNNINNPPISPLPQNQDLFNRFWNLYPKKKGKESAKKAWGKLNPDDALCHVMSAALKRQIKSEDWTKDGGKYVPYPATWLNGRRWEDEDAGQAGDAPSHVPRYVRTEVINGEERDIYE